MKKIKHILKIFITVIFLSASPTSISQNIAYASPHEIKAIGVSSVKPYETLEDYTTYLLINSMVTGDNFKYRRALNESRKNPIIISIEGTTIQSTELLKFFKKAARKADDLEAFRKILSKENGNLENNLSYGQIKQLYTSFRSTTINGYFDELRLALAGG
ncbi:MAG: hypothetical protein AAF554_00895 [Bacteroidota bacterium]